MGIKDPFSYSARFDSVGLDCSYCKYFIDAPNWPDINKTISCGKHKISLAIQLGADCYKKWEWFCKDFTDNPNHFAFSKAVKEFNNVKSNLESKILYRAYSYENDNLLLEFKMNELGDINDI